MEIHVIGGKIPARKAEGVQSSLVPKEEVKPEEVQSSSLLRSISQYDSDDGEGAKQGKTKTKVGLPQESETSLGGELPQERVKTEEELPPGEEDDDDQEEGDGADVKLPAARSPTRKERLKRNRNQASNSFNVLELIDDDFDSYTGNLPFPQTEVSSSESDDEYRPNIVKPKATPNKSPEKKSTVKLKVEDEAAAEETVKTEKFQCQDCGATFGYVFNLGRHAQTGVCKRDPKCRICSQLFTDSRSLKQHVQMHLLEGEKAESFKCCKCNMGFCREDALKRHLTKSHPNKITEEGMDRSMNDVHDKSSGKSSSPPLKKDTETPSIDPDIEKSVDGAPSTSNSSGGRAGPTECEHGTGPTDGKENNEANSNFSSDSNGNPLLNKMAETGEARAGMGGKNDDEDTTPATIGSQFLSEGTTAADSSNLSYWKFKVDEMAKEKVELEEKARHLEADLVNWKSQANGKLESDQQIRNNNNYSKVMRRQGKRRGVRASGGTSTKRKRESTDNQGGSNAVDAAGEEATGRASDDMDEPQVEGVVKVDLESESGEPLVDGTNQAEDFGDVSTEQISLDIDIGEVEVKVLHYPDHEFVPQVEDEGGRDSNVANESELTGGRSNAGDDPHTTASRSKSSELEVRGPEGEVLATTGEGEDKAEECKLKDPSNLVYWKLKVDEMANQKSELDKKARHLEAELAYWKGKADQKMELEEKARHLEVDLTYWKGNNDQKMELEEKVRHLEMDLTYWKVKAEELERKFVDVEPEPEIPEPEPIKLPVSQSDATGCPTVSVQSTLSVSSVKSGFSPNSLSSIIVESSEESEITVADSSDVVKLRAGTTTTGSWKLNDWVHFPPFDQNYTTWQERSIVLDVDGGVKLTTKPVISRIRLFLDEHKPLYGDDDGKPDVRPGLAWWSLYATPIVSGENRIVEYSIKVTAFQYNDKYKGDKEDENKNDKGGEENEDDDWDEDDEYWDNEEGISIDTKLSGNVGGQINMLKANFIASEDCRGMKRWTVGTRPRISCFSTRSPYYFKTPPALLLRISITPMFKEDA